MAQRPLARRRRRLSKKELQRRKRKVYRARFLFFLFILAAIFLIIFGVRKVISGFKDKAEDEKKVIVSGESTGDADRSGNTAVAIEFFKNGSLIETITEDFDEELYNQDELKEMAEGEFAQYNEEAGEERLELEEINFEDGKAALSVKYASDEDYTAFNGEEIVFRKIEDVSSTRFTEAVIGVKNSETVASGEIGNLKGTVIIMNIDADIKTPKAIKYASAGVKVTGKRTAEVEKADRGSYIIY